MENLRKVKFTLEGQVDLGPPIMTMMKSERKSRKNAKASFTHGGKKSFLIMIAQSNRKSASLKKWRPAESTM